jgi:type IV secretory pathway VirB4 component
MNRPTPPKCDQPSTPGTAAPQPQAHVIVVGRSSPGKTTLMSDLLAAARK